MEQEFYSDPKGTICEACNYLVDNYGVVPYGEETAKVCIDCYLAVMEEK